MKMSEQDTPIVESKATPEVRAQAEQMGWIPDTRYKGDPENFVDADEYVRRGETVLPIIKKTNENLRNELTQTRAEAKKMAESLAATQAAINEMQARHVVEKQKAVAEARAQVRADLAKASEEGDHVQVALLTDKLVEMAQPEPAPVPKQVAAPKEWTPPAEMVAWNGWFGKD
jgi:hypothetical protein